MGVDNPEKGSEQSLKTLKGPVEVLSGYIDSVVEDLRIARGEGVDLSGKIDISLCEEGVGSAIKQLDAIKTIIERECEKQGVDLPKVKSDKVNRGEI